MDPRTAVKRYYDAWQTRAGDMSGVPLADDFTFTGPVASFDSAAGFRAMASEAGAAVRSFTVRHQFTDGDLVCSVIDWEMAMLPGVLTAAEVLKVTDGVIVSGELIYDAEDLRKAMAPKPIAQLLDRAVQATADAFASIDDAGWSARSRCARWSVRQVGNHLVGGITLLARILDGEPVEAAELDAQRQADTEHLGADPAGSLRRIGKRVVDALGSQEILDRRFAVPWPDITGQAIGHVVLLESLVHGWDAAAAANVPYKPDPEIVAAARDFASVTVTDQVRENGFFGPAVPTPPNADAFTAMLGHLGRHA